ncbi:histidine-rich metal-binding polypeptide [Salpingoeca rosetta]|uniref:Histidine-rich metal-binding polypeptide n=1 Tax=Salpingoeca rosetta (strain ATCC 50818 / BSB-021) TaxID=946362 RepID=F2UNG9_SALR5|nr:histidine-rich metal-binding polypeptide [Salpingoeca rosetta]EGD79174.1 histidine-rich metal-binding polypeptide [Salpingoeca rosetta]|eukprot:XP_004989259.1 histidine-rich metal-binding polypeptide [Salpingoeca rosetta]
MRGGCCVVRGLLLAVLVAAAAQGVASASSSSLAAWIGPGTKWVAVSNWQDGTTPCEDDTVVIQASAGDTAVVQLPPSQVRVVHALGLGPSTMLQVLPNSVLAFEPPDNEKGTEETRERDAYPCAPLADLRVEPVTGSTLLVTWSRAAAGVDRVIVSLEREEASAGPQIPALSTTQDDVAAGQMAVHRLTSGAAYAVSVSVQYKENATSHVPVLTTSVKMPPTVFWIGDGDDTAVWSAVSYWLYGSDTSGQGTPLRRPACDDHVAAANDIIVEGNQRADSVSLKPNTHLFIAPSSALYFPFQGGEGEDGLEPCEQPTTTTAATTTTTFTTTTTIATTTEAATTLPSTTTTTNNNDDDDDDIPDVDDDLAATTTTTTTTLEPGVDVVVQAVLHISQPPAHVNTRQLTAAIAIALDGRLDTHIFSRGAVEITAVLAAAAGNSTVLVELRVPPELKSDTICTLPTLFAPFSAVEAVVSIYTSNPHISVSLVSLTRCPACNCPAGKATCPAGSVLHIITGECLSRPTCVDGSTCTCPSNGAPELVDGSWVCRVETVCSSENARYVPELGMCVVDGNPSQASGSTGSADPSIAIGASVGALALVIIAVFVVWLRRTAKPRTAVQLGDTWSNKNASSPPLSFSPSGSTYHANPMWQPPPGHVGDTTASEADYADMNGFTGADDYLSPVSGASSSTATNGNALSERAQRSPAHAQEAVASSGVYATPAWQAAKQQQHNGEARQFQAPPSSSSSLPSSQAGTTQWQRANVYGLRGVSSATPLPPLPRQHQGSRVAEEPTADYGFEYDDMPCQTTAVPPQAHAPGNQQRPQPHLYNVAHSNTLHPSRGSSNAVYDNCLPAVTARGGSSGDGGDAEATYDTIEAPAPPPIVPRANTKRSQQRQQQGSVPARHYENPAYSRRQDGVTLRARPHTLFADGDDDEQQA